MFKRVIFIPRAVAQTWPPVPASVLISIYDEEHGPLNPQPGWVNLLPLRFDDKDVDGPGVVLFNEAQAQQVLDFVQAHSDCNELVVHCLMGQSRSAAVALFIADMLGVPCFKEGRQVDMSSWSQYNRKVFRVLSDKVHGPIGSAFGEREN